MCVCVCVCVCLCVSSMRSIKCNFVIPGLVSLFNGISTFVGHLMPMLVS